MAKMGRPQKAETKSNSIGLRLSDEQYALLLQYASEHELTITQVVQLALDKLLSEN